MKFLPIIALIILVLGVGSFITVKKIKGGPTGPATTPTPEFADQLSPALQPKVSLSFSADAHYVTVRMTNLHADQLEYNLIYNAVVKKDQIQTGVNASSKVAGQSDYSKEQLLGSESSGHFTYHTNITNAELDLTLRNGAKQSIFTAVYPFTVSPGKSADLSPSE